MSERWKPKCTERYYYIRSKGDVDSVLWNNDAFDREYYQFGNCFRTKKEATNAAKKVRSLLLSGQDGHSELQGSIQAMVTNVCQAMDKGKENVAKATCTFGNLPTLTAEVFDRTNCPKWAKYAAVDENGIAFYYRDIPRKACETWRVDSVLYYQEIPGEWDASDWKHSLIERPANLPDWCKVDAICWHKITGYFKVTYVSVVDNIVYMQQLNDKSTGYLSFYTVRNEVKQARLRPYEAEEMHELLGKYIEDVGEVMLVTGFDKNDNTVKAGTKWYDAERLFNECTVNGKPCGVFEHLNEEGEWVE